MEATAGQATLLIVENEFLVVAPAVELLRESGFEVLQAQDGKEALKVLADNPQIAVIAVDIGLPGINGNEVVRRARAVRPDIRALIVTGYDPSVIEVPEGNATRYLTKPYLPEDFLDKIRSLFAASD